ncbi:hypothetical protein LSH36_92g05010 [Paralvinella palmiformis]|uniref:Uncharacterized protein n=1 Tax=Paralvinella palmiformis TaxID=53620 RepID=A0AAD9NC37_9ANNE|nr:hypothetical protein LSH36_92g05010 [Paralvinella palmiformis]
MKHPSDLASWGLNPGAIHLWPTVLPVRPSRSPTVLLSSPFQCELSKLRMERLRIEEEHLLEVKRQEELERIRGPSPKWYELKNARFHYEAHKNNELLKSSDDWQSLLDYRNELEQASKQFQKHHSTTS